MRKRVISCIVALAMFCAALPNMVYAADIKSLINHAALQPVQNELYAERVNEILAECGYGKADTYTVFKNCYAWLINNVRYRTEDDPYDFASVGFLGMSQQSFINAKAYAPLYQGFGVCTEYAAALYIFAQAIGLTPYLCTGETRKSGGGYTGHTWLGIVLNGEMYMFDAQVEDNITKNGEIRYYYFGKTLDELGGSHILDETSEEQLKMATNTAEIRVMIDGELLDFEQPPVVMDGRTLVPLRKIFQKMGATVDWEQDTKQITAVKGEIEIRMQADSKYMYKNEEMIPLDVPATIINGRVLVPTRAIAEAFGCDVVWNKQLRIVEITRDQNDAENSNIFYADWMDANGMIFEDADGWTTEIFLFGA